MIISPRLKFLFLEHFQPAISTVYGFLSVCFRLNSNIRHKTGTHVFWENGVDYPRVSPGAHPLAKKPEDSGYEIVDLGINPVSLQDFLGLRFANETCTSFVFTCLSWNKELL